MRFGTRTHSRPNRLPIPLPTMAESDCDSYLSVDSEDESVSEPTNRSRVHFYRKSPSPANARARPIRQPIQHPTMMATLKAYTSVEQDLVLLDPEYQRDVVWSDQKQSNLIDSLQNGYAVPFVILSERFIEGRTRLVCVDGKQRLTSIKRFMDGEIPFIDSSDSRKKWYSKSSGSRRLLITEEERLHFSRQLMTTVIYHDLNEEQERDIFQRVQNGTALTPVNASTRQKARGRYLFDNAGWT